MNQDEFRVEIVKHMATTNERLAGIDKRLENVEGKVDTMSVTGCAKGAENERRIEKLELPGRKQLAGGAVAGGGIAAVIVGVVKILEAVVE